MMSTPSITSCPPIDLIFPPILIAEWQPVKGVACFIPVHLRSFKSGQWCPERNGRKAHCHDPDSVQLNVGGRLLWAEPIGPYTIAAVSVPHYCARLIHHATFSVVKQIVMKEPWDSDFEDPIEGLGQRRARAIATAELAALILKEQRVGGRRRTDGEAWLRSQLEGLEQTIEGR